MFLDERLVPNICSRTSVGKFIRLIDKPENGGENLQNSTILNGTIVLDTRTDDDLSESCLVLRKLITDGYSVDVHPYIDENDMTEFVKVDIYDEKLSSVDYAADYHAAAEDDNYTQNQPFIPNEFIAKIDGLIKGIDNAVKQAMKNAKQN